MLSIDSWLDEKPYREVFDDVIHEKVSPQPSHGFVAFRMCRLLDDWANRRGVAGVEIRVYLKPGTTLVPDVAFFSGARWAPLSEEERLKPPFAPDIVVEVRSPDDREARIKRKTTLYLTYGAVVVLNVDPDDRMVRMSSLEGEHTLRSGDTLEHPAFPGLCIPVATIFEPLDFEPATGR